MPQKELPTKPGAYVVSSQQLPRMVVSALKAILSEDFVLSAFERFESRRNEVYKIISSQPSYQIIVAKFYHQPGIAHETSVLQEAATKEVPVPQLIGTTSNVLLMEYIEGPNLCDLINANPRTKYGRLLANWLINFQNAFQVDQHSVLVKGDARLRNFLLRENQVVGVDFEESYVGSYDDDLIELCASILDTDPLFTKKKFQLCNTIIRSYARQRRIRKLKQFKQSLAPLLIARLWQTSVRRGNPPDLVKYIQCLEAGTLAL
jgi:tRNA A-37 threonylcarbamoyl transferase component Bud32